VALALLGWIPLWLISRQPAIAGPLLHCAPTCPRNVLFVGTASELRRVLAEVVRIGYAVVTIGLVFVLVQRLRRASRLTRSMLGPVLVVSIAYAVVLALSLLFDGRRSGLETLLDWLVLLAVPAVPLALLVGLVREDLFLKRALEGLLTALPTAQTPLELRRLMNKALGDARLLLVFWSDRHQCFTDLHGTPLQLPADGVTLQKLDIPDAIADGEGTAAIVVDSTLADDPRFMRAVTAAVGMAVHRYRLEADLRSSRLRLVAAADRERERLERDLHDGVQQRLVALRVRLGMASDLIAARTPDGARVYERLDAELGAAIEELREVAHGLYPHLLDRFGLAVALEAAARRSAHPATVTAEGAGRYDPELELAVYFCCLEALQNADKHAGPNAATAVRLWHEDAMLRFEVSDRGRGFALAQTPAGAARPSGTAGVGLQNMRDRIGAAGGVLSIRSTIGAGTVITGAVPVGPASVRFTRPAPDAVAAPERDDASSGVGDVIDAAQP
jgi:signal transduction histidine kinase